MQLAAALAASWLLFGALHEISHLLTACAVGCGGSTAVSAKSLWGALVTRRVRIDVEASGWRARVVRAAGWVTSLALAAATWLWRPGDLGLVSETTWSVVRAVATFTAAEAAWTDLLGMEQAVSSRRQTFSPLLPPHTWFYCGNFGMVILSKLWLTTENGDAAKDILQKMIQVTMMRGAQSGGVVTYLTDGRNGGHGGMFGARARVVNTKRGDLSVGVRTKLTSEEKNAGRNGLVLRGRGRLYVGHTRFATSSKASFDGTHPHQWSPRVMMQIWSGFRKSEATTCTQRWVENYICHNGDFDFYTIGARTYDLSAIQEWLPRATGHPMPTTVDSCAVAGMIDLLRAQGSWFHAARFAFHFGAFAAADETRTTLKYAIPTVEALSAAAGVLVALFMARVRGDHVQATACERTVMPMAVSDLRTPEARASLAEAAEQAFRAGGHDVALGLDADDADPRGAGGGGGAGLDISGAGGDIKAGSSESDPAGRKAKPKLYRRYSGITGRFKMTQTFKSSLALYVRSCVDAFFDNDLLWIVRLFMANAKGSFGLCVTSSLDAHRQICMAARGQTMSLAFYPRTGLVLYGSEQAAVKAACKLKFPKAAATAKVKKFNDNLGGAPPSAEAADAPNGLDRSIDSESDNSEDDSEDDLSNNEGDHARTVSTASGRKPSMVRADTPKVLFERRSDDTLTRASRDSFDGRPERCSGDAPSPPTNVRRAGGSFDERPERRSGGTPTPYASRASFDDLFGGGARGAAASEFAAWSAARDTLERKRADDDGASGDDYSATPAVRLDLDDLGGEVCLASGYMSSDDNKGVTVVHCRPLSSRSAFSTGGRRATRPTSARPPRRTRHCRSTG